MRLLTALLLLLLVSLQYKLWLGEGGLRELWTLREAVARQAAENARLAARNQALAAEVQDLRDGQAAIEERARSTLGMIREGETFYRIVERHGASGLHHVAQRDTP